MKKKRPKKIVSFILKIVFICLFLLVILLFYIQILFKGQTDINNLENRTANKIPTFSLTKIINNKFQENTEKAVNDQILGSNYFKIYALQIRNFLSELILDQLKSAPYKLVVDEYYNFNGDDYLLSAPYNDNYIEINNYQIKKIAQQYESIPLKNKYLYLINDEKTVNLERPNNNFYDKLITYYPSFKTSYLAINSYEDYKNYYLKNDHHYNYKGAYQSYIDIVKLMLGENEKVLKPVSEVHFDYNIYGSKSTKAQFFKYKEKFIAYKFNMPKFSTYVDGEKKEYGNKSALFKNHNYLKDKIITYGYFYGYDTGEVIYDFKQPEKKNLLIIGYSDTCAIQELLASHFNKTYVVDLRHFKNFDVNQYIKENKIDDFLLLSNWFSSTSNDSYLWR